MSQSPVLEGPQVELNVSGERRLNDPEWYKDAIIYEVRVRSFYDSDGDGLGDFRGLTEKLDYLQDLGVTALWLLPFYPSPLRDDGYDISEYTDVHREVGSLDDFKAFLAAAQRRGLQVITELVLNHTSDQHPWFQRARRAPPGSPERDFYVWSDTADRYQEARIIFKDFEHSNWTWDPLARAYFWHRFYSHQPDLNFDNLAVHDALLKVVDFWFELGIDGLRLDAVPYLYEREGTSSENLPETHAFLKKLRRHMDERYPGRMILAEANQWPEEAAAYFGQGDECHMAFHFPIMPRLFMAIHLEDRFPLIDILAQTPALSEGCQWALFLRNHDELTLEMVTDEERDYMYRAYARDQTMRINLGIRRRLAPLLGNDRRNMELMNGLLFSLPGTPVLYYGDEIGMGDNVFLGDRNGVRTPMQWSSDRNAGFSRANPQRLILPVVIDPEYHFESVNVEAQQNNPNSLLWWTKRLIALRKRFAAFGRGTIEFLSPDNHKVLAFIRRFGNEVILVVANLSRFVQFVELDLSKLRGRVPVELFGGNALPPIRDLPYLLTLGGHAFYWFSLELPVGAEDASRVEGYQPPSVEVAGPWARFVEGSEGAASIDLPEVLSGYLASRPWFGGRRSAEDSKSDARPALKGPASTDVQAELSIREAILIGELPAITYLVIASKPTDGGDPERYFIPLAFETEERAALIRGRSPQAVVAEIHARTKNGPVRGILIDALADGETRRTLLETLLGRSRFRGVSGEVVAKTIAVGWTPVAADGTPLPRAPGRDDLQIEPRSLRDGQQSAVELGNDRFFLKLFRHLEEGTSPDLEVGRFLAERAPTPTFPPLSGFVEYRPDRGEPITLAVIRRFTDNEGDSFNRGVEEIGRAFEQVLTQHRDEQVVAVSPRSVLSLSSQETPALVRALINTSLDNAELLGRRTAELHLSFAGDARTALAPDGAHREASVPSLPPAFTPEPYTPFDQRSTYQSMRNRAGKVLRSLGIKLRSLPPSAVADAQAVLGQEGQVMKRFGAILERRLTALRTRYHGDYHLGRVLFTGKDFVFVDFEGDRLRTLSERRRKGTVIRDLASMIRSFHYAAMTALLDENRVRKEDRGVLDPWAHLFHAWVSAAFLRGYFHVAEGASFLPRDPSETAMLLDAFLLKKAFNELGTELEDISERVLIPLRGLARLLEVEPAAGEPASPK